jgi:hypothetical protein
MGGIKTSKTHYTVQSLKAISLFEKLFPSPRGQGIMVAPSIYMLLGAGMSIYAIVGLFSGEMDVARYGTREHHSLQWIASLGSQ